MESVEMVSAGIGDPYWYEWFVGLGCVISMLDSDSVIESVTFQKGDYSAIDDVVVKYTDGKQEYCYQVKHEIETSSKNALTFNEIVKVGKNGKSLVSALASGWIEASSKADHDISLVLFTNRSSAKNKSQRTYKARNYQAVPLGEFLTRIQKKISEAGKPVKLDFATSEDDLRFQWLEFVAALDIPDDSIFSFVDKFSVNASQASLSELKTLHVNSIGRMFGCNQENARKIFNRLVAELQVWTTSMRKNEKVTVEIVYEALSTELEISNEQHRLPPPKPFFHSREEFCCNVVSDLCNITKPVVFVSGEPGSGKTSIVSHIQAQYDFFTLRFHAFRPISPEQRFYDADVGLCEPRQLWIELMIQIRSRLKGRLRRHNVPVICDHITDIDLRSEVMRLLSVISDETNRTVFVCVDGIDHAARSNLKVSFLSSLFFPSEIPKGVCFVIVGQPPNMYSEYPLWLQNKDSLVYPIEIPALEKRDIQQLVSQKAPQYLECAENVAELMFPLTKGNNLSVVYAVEAIRRLTSFDELIGFAESGLISHDIKQYYNNIWKHVVNAIISKNVVMHFAESKIAASILLLNGRIYTRLLHESMKVVGLSLHEWNQLMDSLYPLITPGNAEHEYNIFHNDFRIYLMNVVSKYPETYKEVSYQLALHLLKSDWGIVKYRNLLPLLKCAERTEYVSDCFNVSFVINALAEGLSYDELDDYAAVAYSEATKAKQISKYHSVYLALSTLHQHRRYFEYYDRKYVANGFQDIIPIDISEMRATRLSKESVDDYYDALIRCRKLHLAGTPDMKRRAISLYELWFNSLTPTSLVSSLYPDAKYPDGVDYDTRLEETIKLWGRTCAQLNVHSTMRSCDKSHELHENESRAELLFGNAVFSHYIEHGLYEEAIASTENVRISTKCISEKLEDILLNGIATRFEDLIFRLLSHELEASDYLFATSILLVANAERHADVRTDDSIESVKHVHDETSMNAVALAYIIGTCNSSRDEIVTINKAYEYLDISDDRGSDVRKVPYLKLLMRIAALLGKYNCILTKSPSEALNGDLLYKQLCDFFDKPAVRSFEFSKAFKFLLYIILNTAAVDKMIEHDSLCLNLKHALLTFGHIGMHYKSIILDFLLKKDRLDIIREYLLALYGESGESLCMQEDWASTHKHFLPYSSIAIPKISSVVSNRQKWDIVSYSGKDDAAIGKPLEVFKKCSALKPEMWETQGLRLYTLSKIADNFSNTYSFDVVDALSENAALCSINSFWRLHHIDSDYHRNLVVLHKQLDYILLMASTEQDIITVWILACGLLSWYNNDDRARLKDVYNACIEREKKLGFSSLPCHAKEHTPTQYDIATKETVRDRYSNSSGGSEYRKEKDLRLIMLAQEMEASSTAEIIEQYVDVGSRFGETENIDIAWKEILSRGELNDAITERFINAISSRLGDRPWRHYGCDFIIKQLRDFSGIDAFWGLAEIINTSLSDHEYQTSTMNISYLITIFSDLISSELLGILDAELRCQEQWVSGNDHFTFPEVEERVTPRLLMPSNMHELVMNILLEQFEINNIHRNEIAIPAVYALCISSPILYDWLANNWEFMGSEQKDAIILICERWGREAPIEIENLICILKESYEMSNRLSEKMKLYSILDKCFRASERSLGELTYNAYPELYELSMPRRHTPIVDSDVPVGIKAFIELNAHFTDDFDTGLDIVKYIREHVGIKERKSEQYFRTGDCILVRNLGMCVVDPVLYGEEIKERWHHLPLEWRMQYFLDIDDAWVLTNPPAVTYDDSWGIEKDLEACLKNGAYRKAESISQIIINSGLRHDEDVLGSCLWYPVGYQNEGIIVFGCMKAIHKGNILCNNRIYQTFINYSMLSDSDNLLEFGPDNTGKDGACLVRCIVGSAQFMLGNCQIYPANFMREFFGWTPLVSNPLVWIDDLEDTVLRFERIIYPRRETIQQNYIRQPMLFRWIVDKRKLETQLEEKGLSVRTVCNTLPYSKMFQHSDD
jgi:hypothetical protein